MPLIKRLIFCVPFLLAFLSFCLLLKPFFMDPLLILSLEKGTFTTIFATLATLATSLFFVVFATLAQQWKFILVIIPAVVLTSLLFISFPLSVFFSIFCLIIFFATYFFLQKKLNTYLTFQASTLLIPSITQLVTLLLLVASFAFYISCDQNIKQNGFKLPPSLITATMQFMPAQEAIPQTLIKEAIETQVQNMIQPYLHLIPFILTVIFFVSLKSLASLLSFFLRPILWFVFWVLEETKFTAYTTEVREVKKLILT